MLYSIVELLARYSNREDLLSPLVDVLRRIEAGDRTDEPGVQSVGSSQPWHVEDRLTPDKIEELGSRFYAGTPKHKLAAEYGVSESTIKRLLKKHRPQAS